MAMIDKELVSKLQNTTQKIKAVQIGNMIGFVGPWLPNNHYEGFQECLIANQQELARQDQKRLGLNDTWQNEEQAKAFEKRKKISAERKRKAELAGELASQNK